MFDIFLKLYLIIDLSTKVTLTKNLYRLLELLNNIIIWDNNSIISSIDELLKYKGPIVMETNCLSLIKNN